MRSPHQGRFFVPSVKWTVAVQQKMVFFLTAKDVTKIKKTVFLFSLLVLSFLPQMNIWSGTPTNPDPTGMLDASLLTVEDPTVVPNAAVLAVASATLEISKACTIESKNHLNLGNHSEAPLKQSLARIIILQRGGGYKLEVLLQHYLHVLAFDDIVVIDNMSDDSQTLDLLNLYSKQGIHLWKCDADYKHTQGMMVTHVTRWAAPFSDFVFPVDVDELLGVRVTFNESPSTNKTNYHPIHNKQPTEPTVLVWNKQVFDDALSYIDTKEGKMLKMGVANPIPPACDYDPEDKNYTKVSITPQQFSSDSVSVAFQQDVCRTKYANVGEPYCFSKSFAVGKDFYETEDGNHKILEQVEQSPNAPGCIDVFRREQAANRDSKVAKRDIHYDQCEQKVGDGESNKTEQGKQGVK
mgnify:CR=1 FL=1